MRNKSDHVGLCLHISADLIDVFTIVLKITLFSKTSVTHDTL